MSDLTHLTDDGRVHMVDISAKDDTSRVAIADGSIEMSDAALAAIKAGDVKKGDVLAVARVAAIMAAKKTSELIPLCHPIALSNVDVEFSYTENGIKAVVTARTSGQTGVEMEALTAVSAGLLTIYDMAKALDKSMIIGNISLASKSGGRSGDWRR